MCRELYHFMVFLWKSILIEVAFSPLDSGKAFKMLWELISPLAQLSILNLAVKSKGLTKFWKTCSELVLSHSERTGRNLFHLPSLLITTVQSSMNMAPFEFLYGQRCRTPLNWSKTGERQFFGPDMIKEAEDQVRIVRDQLKAAQSRQKSYYDRHHRQESYNLDEKAYLRVTPLKGTQRFGIKGKLAPRYIGPFRILAKRGEVAYQLELPLHLSLVHDVFHVSQLRHCFKDPIHEVDHETLDLQDDLSYREHPVRILDSAERVTRRQKIQFLKVQWPHHSEKEATWEREDHLRV